MTARYGSSWGGSLQPRLISAQSSVAPASTKWEVSWISVPGPNRFRGVSRSPARCRSLRKNWDLIKRFISDRFASQLEDIRTDIGIPRWITGSAGVVQSRDFIATDLQGVILDDFLATSSVSTEQGTVSARGARETRCNRRFPQRGCQH